MTYVKATVGKPGNNMGAGGNKKDKITLFDWDDVLTAPSRDSKGIVITDNIVFKPNAYMITVYGTQDTIKFSSTVEGDPDKEGIIQELSFEHPGDEIAIREFRANWMSRNIGAFVERCSNTKKNLFGTPCAPLRLQFKMEDDKDKSTTTFTLKSSQKGPDYADYQGTFTFDTVKATVAAGTLNVNVAAGEGKYQLTSSVSELELIENIINPVDGGIYTLLGSGGAYPIGINTSDNFRLHNGIGWNALAGSTITFKAFKYTDVAYTFIELSRT